MSYMQNPAVDSADVVADTAFVVPCSCIYVGTGGNVEVVMKSGTTQIYTSVPAGTFMPIRATMVVSTNTTASNMVALFN